MRMKLLRHLLLSLLLVVMVKAQIDTESILKSYGPIELPNNLTKVNYPGDSNFDVTYYKLNINVNHTAQNIIGEVTVEAKSTINNLTSIFLDLQNVLVTDSVVSNNTKLNFSQPSGSAKLNITLDKSYNSGGNISLIVYYHGTPGSSGFGSFTFGSTKQVGGQPSIYTLSEPYGASDWWPCKDTPADKADSADIWITCTNDLKAISNGILIGIVDNGNGTHTYKWKTKYSIAQYLISMVIAPYEEYDIYFHYNSTDSMLVSNFLYPETMTANNKAILDKTLDMLSIFSDKFGPYPFVSEKYGHAQFGWGGGMEHQTITSIGGVSENLIAHELAHQWYGDKITCKNWENIWLNEGFATFSTGLYNEFKYGRDLYNSYIVNNMNSAKNAQGSIYVQDISSVASIFNGSRSYSKGSVVLHMLRGIVGDTDFFNIMKVYAADPDVAYGVAETADFQRVTEEIYGSSLDYFFNEWIFGENYPKYTVNWGYSDLGAGKYSIKININQNENTNPIFFTMPLDIKILFGNKDTLVTVFNDKQNQNFVLSISDIPTDLIFDPNNKILKDIISINHNIKDEILKFDFTLYQNYPNPFNPNTKISYSVPEKSFVSIFVTDILGRKVVELLNEEKIRGNYTFSFDASNLSSGIYFYTLSAGNFLQTKKMILLK